MNARKHDYLAFMSAREQEIRNQRIDYISQIGKLFPDCIGADDLNGREIIFTIEWYNLEGLPDDFCAGIYPSDPWGYPTLYRFIVSSVNQNGIIARELIKEKGIWLGLRYRKSERLYPFRLSQLGLDTLKQIPQPSHRMA